MKVFSFCLYGSKPKYIRGMFENIKMIQTYFPEWKIFIYCGDDVQIDILNALSSHPTVTLHKGWYTGNQLMLDRFTAIDESEVEVVCVRDADSRIHERDRWCVAEFLNSDKLFHSIRDHPYHRTVIMGGLWAMKKGCIDEKMRDLIESYRIQQNHNGFDQSFLRDILYPRVFKTMILHGRIQMYPHEQPIPIPLNTPHMFCGQAIEYDARGHEYHNCDDCRAILMWK